MLKRALVAFAVLCACHPRDDQGFEVVKVPLSAYAAVDASARSDGGSDARADSGRDRVVVCIEKPDTTDEDEKADDDCPMTHEGRNYDDKATLRHHKNVDESGVCCYRRGAPRPRATQPDDE